MKEAAMRGTAIQWCDDTINPVMGCEGCELAMRAFERRDNVCYAWKLHQFRSGRPGWAKDFFVPEMFEGRMSKAARWPDLTGHDRPDKPWLSGLPRTIFVSDLGDALSESIPFEFLKREIIDVVTQEPGPGKRTTRGAIHQWLWLTKRPNRMAEFSKWLEDEFQIPWPPNLWAGTSVTSRAKLTRLGHLKRVGDSSTIRFVSVEPLWEEVSLSEHLRSQQIHWVITGGESKQNKGHLPHTFELDWARRIRDECREHGVPLFLKQLGGNVTDRGQPFDPGDSHGGNWDIWPDDLKVREMPGARLANGRLLAVG
jgi:protein gp37